MVTSPHHLASEAGLRGNASGNAYTASKHGIIGVTKSAAFMYGPKGIRVNAVAPGFVTTPILATIPDNVLKEMEHRVPLKRLGKPEEFADLVAYILGNTYINGETIRLDGATRLAPK